MAHASIVEVSAHRRPTRRSRLAALATLTLAGIATVPLAACTAPTTVKSEWASPAARPGAVSNVLVVGENMGETSRRKLEDGFTYDLGRRGVSATPSYVLFPGRLPPREEIFASAVRQGSFDSVLIANETEVRSEATYVPTYYDGWWGGYYGASPWSGAIAPGYVATDRVVSFETGVYNPRGGGMIWSLTTDTTNPSSSDDFVKSLGNKVFPAMQEAGILPRKLD